MDLSMNVVVSSLMWEGAKAGLYTRVNQEDKTISATSSHHNFALHQVVASMKRAAIG